MIDTEIFDLLYTRLEERNAKSVRDHLNSDTHYQEAMALECEPFQKYKSLNLPKEQCLVIEQWTDAITARNAAYSSVVFRMGMQCCFSLLIQLAAEEYLRCCVLSGYLEELPPPYTP